MAKPKFPIDKNRINTKNLKSIPKNYKGRSLYYSLATFLQENRISNNTTTNIIKQLKLVIKRETDLKRTLKLISDYYKINIHVWERQSADTRSILEAEGSYNLSIDLLLHDEEYRTIVNHQALTSNYQCSKCEKQFLHRLKPHRCKTETKTIIVNRARKYKPRTFINERICELGTHTPADYRWIHYYAVFDIEAFITKLDSTDVYSDQNILEKQNAALICFASNIPGYEYNSFWRKNENSNFIGEFIDYCIAASECAAELHQRMHDKIISKCLNNANNTKKLFIRKQYMKLLERINKHISQLQIFGFNSKSYDLSLLTAPQSQGSLFYHMKNRDKNLKIMRDPGNSKYMMISSDRMRFVDISRFIPPSSLSNALANYGIQEKTIEELYDDEMLTIENVYSSGGKLLMPYSVASSYEDINGCYRAFTLDDFHNQLTETNLLSPNWDRYQRLKEKMCEGDVLKCMDLAEPPPDPSKVLKIVNSIKDRLNLDIKEYYELYARCDVYSQLKLTTRIIEEYFNLGIPWIFECLTISSCSFNYLMRSIKASKGIPEFFTLLDEESMEIAVKGKMGGVSNAFNRLFIKGLTKIDFHRYGDEAKTANYAQLIDLNQLYTSSLALLPLVCLGYPMLRDRRNNFKITKINGKEPKEMQFIYYLMEHKYSRYTIRSAFSTQGQVRVYLKDIETYHPLDAYVVELKKGINFHGCYYHSHTCLVSDDDLDKPHPTIANKTHRQVREATKQKDWLLGHKCPQLKEYSYMYECEFDQLYNKPRDTFMKKIIKTKDIEYSEKEIIEEIMSNKIQGFVECDLKINPDFYEHFLKLPIIFQKKTITLADLDEKQRCYASENKLLTETSSRDTLFCGMKGDEQVITTEMIKYYKKHNIVFMSNIKRILQFHSDTVFREWGEKMFKKRKDYMQAGKSISATMVKNICNSAYGMSILCPNKRPRCRVIQGNKGLNAIEAKNNIHFIRDVGFTQEPDNLIEVTYFPFKIPITTPQILGVNILLNSKLVFIDFFYRMFVTYFDPRCYMVGAVDTDSYNIIYAYEKISDNVKSHLKTEFESKLHDFIVPSKSHPRYSELANEPFMCKIEIDYGIISVCLCSKCYFILSAYKDYHQANKGINLKIAGNADKTNCMEKIHCLLGNDQPKRNALSRVLKMSKEKDVMELVHQDKRSLNKLNIKAHYCKQGTCFVPMDLDENELSTYFPYLDRECPHNMHSCLEQISRLCAFYNCDIINFHLNEL